MERVFLRKNLDYMTHILKFLIDQHIDKTCAGEEIAKINTVLVNTEGLKMKATHIGSPAFNFELPSGDQSLLCLH